VYNHKRHGCFKLGGRNFDFRIKHHFPYKPTAEFLLVDLVDNLEKLAEDKNDVLSKLQRKISSFDKKTLCRAVRNYGGGRAKKFFSSILLDHVNIDAA